MQDTRDNNRRVNSAYYCNYVNEVITTASESGGTEGVYDALGVLKWEITVGTLW